MALDNIQFINASAGTGKTTQLTRDLVHYLDPENGYQIKPESIIITTFTVKAANEIRERVRKSLLEHGLAKQARLLENGLIGTVHSIGHKLIQHYAFQAGFPPEQEVITDEDKSALFNEAIEEMVGVALQEEIEQLTQRLEMDGDWRQTVEQIVDKARANNLGPEAISQCKADSVDGLLAHLPNVQQNGDFFKKIRDIIVQTRKKVEEEGDSTKKTNDALTQLKQIEQAINREGQISWKTCFELQELDTGNQSQGLIQDLMEEAKKHLGSQDFQNDLKALNERLFDTASQVLAHYNHLKARNGLIDYIDMEAKLLQSLENPKVYNHLKQEVDLLMVDEFQDTSPIQLSIFLKLSEMADYSEWVGDPKQAIFGFRDTDPVLMQQVMAQIPEKAHSSLETSFRSRPSLIELTNAIFSNSFQANHYGNVELDVHRQEDQAMDHPVHGWHLKKADGGDKPNKGEQVKAIARQVKDTLANPPFVDDGDNGKRPLSGGDIAILCRQGNQCNNMANALTNMGLQVAYQGSGLMDTAEGVLFKAALRYLIDNQDSLAAMELQLLTQQTPDQGALIDDRLEYLNQENQEEKWGADNAFIQVILNNQESLKQLPIAKVTGKLISLLDLYHYVAHWPNANQRQANLEELIRLANQYEESCRRFNKAATLSGFLIHLNQLNGQNKDFYGSFSGNNAVQVLTYHKAKGLEWPMVILYELDSPMKEDPKKQVFGLKALHKDGAIDINNPLENRSVRYWPWPYGGKSKVPQSLDETLTQEGEKEIGYRTVLEEEKRLLYVGMTRARDYLVLPYAGKELKKLNNILDFYPEQQLDGQLSDGAESKIEVNGSSVPVRIREVMAPDGEEQEAVQANYYLPFPSGPNEFPPLYQMPSEMTPLSEDQVSLETLSTIHDRLKPEKSLSDDELGNILHSILAAYPETIENADDPLQQTRQVLKQYEANGILDAERILTNARAFRKFSHKNWQVEQVHKEWPLTMMEQGQVYSGFADLVLKTPEGNILVDYKTYQGGAEAAKEKAKEFTGQLALYKTMLEKATGESVIGTYLYFVVSGQLIRVDYNTG